MLHIEYIFLSKIDYNEGYKFQRDKVDEIKNGSNKNYIIFLEHNDVITQGIRTKEEDFLVDKEIIKQNNIQIIRVDRGGSLTAHGPGQLVVYTIFNLKKCHLSLDELIKKIIDSFIYWLKQNGVNATYDETNPGLYIKNKKVLSLGLKLDDFITYHGFALNLNSIPKGFRYIVPCSNKNCLMTSVYLETSIFYDIKQVSLELYDIFKKNIC